LPSLTTDSKDPCGEYYEGFYRANEGAQFYAFKDKDKGTQGFARDLFLDHVRCSYAKGLLTYLNPEALGLRQFKANVVFSDLFKEYEKKILSAYEQTGRYLESLKMTSRAADDVMPSSAAPEEGDDG